jgi:hypothetical protein
MTMMTTESHPPAMPVTTEEVSLLVEGWTTRMHEAVG